MAIGATLRILLESETKRKRLFEYNVTALMYHKMYTKRIGLFFALNAEVNHGFSLSQIVWQWPFSDDSQ